MGQIRVLDRRYLDEVAAEDQRDERGTQAYNDIIVPPPTWCLPEAHAMDETMGKGGDHVSRVLGTILRTDLQTDLRSSSAGYTVGFLQWLSGTL